MTDSLDLGVTTPPMETCAQVGSDDYFARARREAKVFIRQIRRTLGPEPPGARLRIQSSPHDFGSYLTVAVEFDPSDPVTIAYARRCDEQMPEEWDDEARIELATSLT